MYTQIGSGLLYLSLILAWFLFFFHWKHKDLTATSYKRVKLLSFLSCLFLWIPMVILIIAFVSKDYSLIVVFENVDNKMNFFDRLMATWAARPGSMLLWGVLQSTITLTALYYLGTAYKNKSEKRTNTILLFFNALITTFSISVRNPSAFDLMDSSTIIDGLGLIPSLMNFWQQIHPPIAFMAYSSFIVPFAIAITSLITSSDKKLTPKLFWLMDFYMMLGWVLTTIFIVSGSIWSYEVDWGGFWFFDSVQTSSLILWVMASLYFHLKPITRKDHPINMLAASLGWIGVTIAAFIVRGGFLEGPHSYAGDAQRIVFSLLMIGTISGLIYSVKRGGKKVIPDDTFSLKKSPHLYSVLTVWTLVITCIFNLTSVILQIIYAQLELTLMDLTDYYRIINGILLSILTVLLVLCEMDSLKISNRKILPSIILGMLIISTWIFFLPDFRAFSAFIFLIIGMAVFTQFSIIGYSVYKKINLKRISLRLIHLVIILTIFSYVASDPQTNDYNEYATLNSPILIDDYQLMITIVDIDQGAPFKGIPSSILIEVHRQANILGTIQLEQGLYQNSSTWIQGDWLITPFYDIFIKLSEVHQILFFEEISTISIVIKIVPGANIFRANIVFITIIGIIGVWQKWRTKNKLSIE